MQIQLIGFAAVEGRNHKRLTVYLKAYMRQDPSIENSMNGP